MKTLLALFLCALTAAPASAQAWAQGVGTLLGPKVFGADVPAMGKTGALALPGKDGFAPRAVKGGLYEQAKAFAAEVIRIDKELDGKYAGYRKSLAEGDRAPIAELKKERDYYASVWATIVDPAKDLPKDDARVTAVLQALYYYLGPVPARSERLEKEVAAAAKAVEKKRDAVNASVARLHADDRKAVEEFGLAEGDFAKLEAAVPADRKESKEYMGWLKEAYDDSIAWGKAVKVHGSVGEQYAWVQADYLKNAKLAKALMDKKLGPLAAR
ncbi:MAG: hypothetical protein HY928_09835 [Elusimicrobia bacterium]|nr:hypothetical protein [Elusimicrobiota bacterium]